MPSRTTSAFPLLAAATTLVLVGPDVVRANAIASWWVDTDEDYAPQIFKYNESTGIHASLCNSITTPIFAENDSTVLQTEIAPIAGSSIASLGYLNGSTIEADVFYLADLNGESTIASASYTCNTTTGLWTPSGSSYNTYISNGTSCSADAAPAIDPSGGLSALYLGDDYGMRVFFKTAEWQTHYLQRQVSANSSDGSSCEDWSYVGIASNLTTGPEVTSAFLPSKPLVWTIAQTVFVNESAAADPSGEIEISTSNADGVEDLWSINRMPTQIIAELKEDNTTAGILTNMSTTSTSPYRYIATDSWGFSLSSFDAAAARVAAATNSGGLPSVFYLGTDGYLRRLAADTQGHWHEDSSEDDSKWPAASAASADFGLAYDAPNNRIWVYYESQAGGLVQAYQSGVDSWEDFVAVPTYNASLAASSGSSNSTSSSTTGSSSSNSGLSSGAKTAIGVVVGLALPLILAAAAAFFLLRRRRRRRLAAAESDKSTTTDQYHPGDASTTAAGSPTGSDASAEPQQPDQNQGYWQNGMWVEKTATTYYAGGPGAARAGQLGELPVMPVYEAPGHGQGHEKHEMPAGP